jgi:pimeloyl-ACP methyl ester carboxylesterase
MRWALFFFFTTRLLAQMEPCTLERVPGPLLCGFREVPADHNNLEGPKIKLRVVVLKATGPVSLADPLVYLAGGPGGAATEDAPQLAERFAKVRERRDILLVDQRGTGQSARYDCVFNAPGQGQSLASETFPLEAIERCAKSASIPAQLFTTAQSADDLALAAAGLGYDALNLYGVSYGTRLALVFAARHPAQVRSLSLQGAVHPSAPIPLTGTLALQRSLDLLFTACERDPGCAGEYPNVREQLTRMLRRFPDGRAVLTSALMAALSSAATASRLPAIIDSGKVADLLSLASGAGGGGPLASGVYLSIICGEDVPLLRPEDLERAANTVIGDASLRGLMRTCAPWPHAPVLNQLPESSVPALLISGEIDPITSPDQAQQLAAALSQSRHIILRATGHTGAANLCATGMIAQFIETANAAAIDTACASATERPPFSTSFPERLPPLPTQR